MESKAESAIYEFNLRVCHEFERLLKAAPPRPLKKHQLANILRYDVPDLTRRELESKVLEFYTFPHERRTERQFARLFKIKPYPWLMEQFVLNFSNASVSETEMTKMAGRFRHHFRFIIEPPDEINSVNFLQLVIYRTANPRWDQVNTGIDLPIFADRWRSASFAKFGEKHDHFFYTLDQQIELSYNEPLSVVDAKREVSEQTSTTDLNLTQTDLEWMKEVIQALDSGLRLPLYPLQRGPTTPTILRMEQLVRGAHRVFPLRHAELENTLRRACLCCLQTHRQSAKQCDTTLVAS